MNKDIIIIISLEVRTIHNPGYSQLNQVQVLRGLGCRLPGGKLEMVGC